MPVRKRGDSWEVCLDLAPDPTTGRRRRRYLTIRGSKKDALRALTAAERQRDTGIDILPGKLTVAAYFERWLTDYAAVKVAPTTFARYTGITRHHVVPAIGHLKLADLRPQHLQNAYALWLRPGSRRDGSGKALSSQTVLHHHRLISEALEQAVRWQLIALNPAHAVSAPRVDRTEVRVLDPEGVGRLLEAARETPFYTFVYLSIRTGARLGELLGLQWSDITLDAGQMHIRRTLKRIDRRVTLGPTKTRRSERPVDLSRETVQVLREHRRQQVEQRLATGAAYTDSNLVFATETGHYYDDSNLRRSFRKILQAAGLTALRIHDLRHCAASLMLKAGTPITTVAERLGHASTTTTYALYAHSVPGSQSEAAEALDALLRQAQEG